jgi:hypothetical protein
MTVAQRNPLIDGRERLAFRHAKRLACLTDSDNLSLKTASASPLSAVGQSAEFNFSRATPTTRRCPKAASRQQRNIFDSRPHGAPGPLDRRGGPAHHGCRPVPRASDRTWIQHAPRRSESMEHFCIIFKTTDECLCHHGLLAEKSGVPCPFQKSEGPPARHWADENDCLSKSSRRPPRARKVQD